MRQKNFVVQGSAAARIQSLFRKHRNADALKQLHSAHMKLRNEEIMAVRSTCDTIEARLRDNLLEFETVARQNVAAGTIQRRFRARRFQLGWYPRSE